MNNNCIYIINTYIIKKYIYISETEKNSIILCQLVFI